MKNVFRKPIAILLVILFLTAMLPMTVLAADDVTPPIIRFVHILDDDIDAGEPIKIEIGVDENETGLTYAEVQLGHMEASTLNLLNVKSWNTPQYGSAEKPFVFTMEVPTTQTTIGGEWVLSYLVLQDAKGNRVLYEELYEDGQWTGKLASWNRDSDTWQVVEDSSIFVKINSDADAIGPILNDIKIKQTTVQKPGAVTVEMNITEESGFNRVQFDFLREGNSIEYLRKEFFSAEIPQKSGTHTYTFDIPVGEDLRNGVWYIQHIYLYDTLDNVGHYTSERFDGVLGDYYNEEGPTLPLPKFTLTGEEDDEMPPSVRALKVLEKDSTILKPGVLNVELDLIEEGSGVVYLEGAVASPDYTRAEFFNLCTEEGRVYYGGDATILDQPLKTGTHKISVPIPSTILNGEYIVYVFKMIDAAGNIYQSNLDDQIKVPLIIEDEFDYDFEVSITNSNLTSKIEAMEEGKVGRVLLSSTRDENILKKEALDAIAGKDKKLVCYRDGYQWIFDGLTIDPEKTKDLNLTAEIIKMNTELLKNDHSVICADFENNGELPGKVQFRFKTDYVRYYLGLESKLWFYHLDQDNKENEGIDFAADEYQLVPKDHANMKIVHDGEDSWCYVDITHNSKYILSDEEIVKLKMTDAKVGGINCCYNYTGSYLKPQPTVSFAGRTLTLDQDFKVAYKNNKAIGTATVTITGINQYESFGSKDVAFVIGKKGTAATGHSFRDGKCTVCGTEDPDYNATPGDMNGITRIYGSNRYETAFKAADELKATLGGDKFENIIVACGTNFADALGGSYLAAVKNAPILLVNAGTVNSVKTYIKSNLKTGGTVYILGGTNAVPATMDTGLNGFTVKRFAGSNRYDTNLQILKEAGVGNADILVATGTNFADSLSASATGKPILLVGTKLTSAQKRFLAGTSGTKYILGGTSAVSEGVENELRSYGTVKRLGGANRYATSVLIANEFFPSAKVAALAYAQNFPDGLSGGAVAYAKKAPMLLVVNGGGATEAAKYTASKGIKGGYVFGGPGLISDATAKQILG